ncbi:ABC transporter ATP-binding protein [Spirochaetota bacterium]
MNILTVNNLLKQFGGLNAVNNVSFGVEEGSIKGIIGPNGAGKTTLFNLISGALKPDEGEIYFRGEEIHGLQPHRIARKGISRTFQAVKLFSSMTVLENVMIGRHVRTKAGFIAGILSLPWTHREEKEIRSVAMDILNLLGIEELAYTEATSLPFGKQRVVEFARALATGPDFLLLDEPAAGLNINETTGMSRLIRTICDRGITVLIIEHDMSLIMDISDEIVVLNSGKKIAEGVPKDIRAHGEVINAYLGVE